jgi:N utilization substance protein B
LAEVDALLTKSYSDLMDTEIEHPTNVRSIAQLLPVTLSSEQVKEQLANLKRALNQVSEALDIPALAMQSHPGSMEMVCQHCQQANTFVPPALDKSEVKYFLVSLVTAYAEHRQEIDDFIRQAKAKWQIERMVSIDRDILRLACAEAFYMPDIPVAVAINEAVELCHRFADEKAAKFINGILADLAKDAEYYRQHGAFPEKIPAGNDNLSEEK